MYLNFEHSQPHSAIHQRLTRIVTEAQRAIGSRRPLFEQRIWKERQDQLSSMRYALNHRPETSLIDLARSQYLTGKRCTSWFLSSCYNTYLDNLDELLIIFTPDKTLDKTFQFINSPFKLEEEINKLNATYEKLTQEREKIERDYACEEKRDPLKEATAPYYKEEEKINKLKHLVKDYKIQLANLEKEEQAIDDEYDRCINCTTYTIRTTSTTFNR